MGHASVGEIAPGRPAGCAGRRGRGAVVIDFGNDIVTAEMLLFLLNGGSLVDVVALEKRSVSERGYGSVASLFLTAQVSAFGSVWDAHANGSIMIMQQW